MTIMEERRKKILEEVIKKGAVSVHDLSSTFDVSYETIRKDLSYLEEQKQLIKSHGGAISNQNSIENPFTIRKEENIDRKQSIANKALSLIPEGASIILGTGSTVFELAKLLSLKKNLKIFTDLIPAINYLQNSDNEIFLLGGKVRQKSSSVYGYWTEKILKQISVDISFLGTDGFNNFSGPTTPSYYDASVERTIIERGKKCFILADSTKFTRSSLYQFTDWSNITSIITNNDINSKLVDKLSKYTDVIVDNFSSK